MSQSASRPNVVVIVADQFRHDMFGLASGPFAVKTPNLDKLAARGIRFKNAYSANPTCMPNRASIATGRWPSVHGTSTNGITFDAQAETFMHALNRSGYLNHAIGKLHHQVMGWPWEDFQIEEMRVRNPEILENIRDAVSRGAGDWQNWENARRHRDTFVQLPHEFYGYKHVDLVVGHGDNPSGHFHHWANSKGVSLNELAGWKNSKERSETVDEVFVSEVPEELHPNAFIVEKFNERLAQANQQEDPFLFFISFPDPHHPFAPPRSWFNNWKESQISVPENFLVRGEGLPAHIDAFYKATGQSNLDSTMTWAPTQEQMVEILRAQMAQIEFLDHAVGEILQSLAEAGNLDDTYVIFTGDHGDLMGERGLVLKHFVHFDAVTRVPLIVAGPGIEARVDDRLVSSVDIAPTVIALTRSEKYRGIQGKDLLNGELESSWRSALVIEEDQPFGIEGLPGPVKIRTLVTQDYRFTVYGDSGQAELYDRSHGLEDTKNLYDHSDLERGEAYARLAHELIRITDDGIAPIAGA